MNNSSTAKVNTTSKISSRRGKKPQESLNKTVALDPAKTNDEQNLNISKGAQVLLLPVQAKLQETSVSTPLPGNRPIDASNLQVLGTIFASGERPIFASTIKVWHTMSASGERPISSSSLQLSGTAMIMENRPIASNHLDDAEDLIDYLD